jgi:hypothetical protein
MSVRTRTNRVFAVAQQSKDRPRAQIPTGPRQRRISVCVARVDDRPGVQQGLDGFRIAKGRRAVERRLAARTAIPHEGIRFDSDLGRAIRIGAVTEQNLEDSVEYRAVGLAEGRVQRGLVSGNG